MLWMRWLSVALLATLVVPAAAMAQSDENVYQGVEDWSGEGEEGEGAEGEGEEADTPPGDYPLRYTLRPITLNKLRIRGDAMFTVFRVPDIPGIDNVATGLFLGGAIGIMDDLEVGISAERVGSPRIYPLTPIYGGGFGEGLLPFIFSPDFDFGDLPIYGRYRFLNTDMVQMGADLTLVVPTNTDFQMRVGVPVRLMLADAFVIDTGVTFGLVFGESPMDPTDDFFAWMDIPVRIEISPIEALTIGVHTGFRVVEFDGDFVSIPLGFEGIFSTNLGPLLTDFVAGFQFPYFLSPGNNGDKLPTGFWIITAGVRVHFQA